MPSKSSNSTNPVKNLNLTGSNRDVTSRETKLSNGNNSKNDSNINLGSSAIKCSLFTGTIHSGSSLEISYDFFISYIKLY